MKPLELKDLGIPELNLTNPLYYGTLKFFLKNYKVDFDVFLPTKNVNLQRGLVWSDLQKQELILSVFKQKFGSYNGVRLIPPFHAVRLSDTEFQIIDGKQRLTTLISYYNNEFPIEINGEKYFYNDLDKQLQNAISGFSVELIIKYHYDDDPVTDEDKINWFEIINYSGTPQEKSHLENLKKVYEQKFTFVPTTHYNKNLILQIIIILL